MPYTPTDHDILNTMRTYGGSFLKALAQAALYADKENLARLKNAFPDYWESYREMTVVMAAKNGVDTAKGKA